MFFRPPLPSQVVFVMEGLECDSHSIVRCYRYFVHPLCLLLCKATAPPTGRQHVYSCLVLSLTVKNTVAQVNTQGHAQRVTNRLAV